MELDKVFQSVQNTRLYPVWVHTFHPVILDGMKRLMALVELPERCLYSSDAPYGEPYLYRQLIEFVSPNKTTAKMALGENIEKLLDSLGLIT